MSRPDRVAAFRRATGKGEYITSLRSAGANHPRDAGAIRDWYLRAPALHPICFGCRGVFPNVRAAAFLTARSSRSPNSGTAVTAICTGCWAAMTPDAIESAAAAVLRRNLTGPTGRFLDE